MSESVVNVSVFADRSIIVIVSDECHHLGKSKSLRG